MQNRFSCGNLFHSNHSLKTIMGFCLFVSVQKRRGLCINQCQRNETKNVLSNPKSRLIHAKLKMKGWSCCIKETKNKLAITVNKSITGGQLKWIATKWNYAKSSLQPATLWPANDMQKQNINKVCRLVRQDPPPCVPSDTVSHFVVLGAVYWY